MTTLTEFLLARIAEDEAVARAADVKQGDPSWMRHGPNVLASPRTYRIRSERDRRPIALIEDVSGDDGDRDSETSILDGAAVATHVARHDPARVLAECQAKRRIVECHQQWPVLVETARPDVALRQPTDWSDRFAVRVTQEIEWLTTQAYIARFGHEPPTTPVLRALAQVYADHPDYNLEWTTA